MTSAAIQRVVVVSTYATASFGAFPGVYSPGVFRALSKRIYVEPGTSDIYTIGVQFLSGTYHVDLSVEWVELF